MDVVVEGTAHPNINCTVFNIWVRCTPSQKIIVKCKNDGAPRKRRGRPWLNFEMQVQFPMKRAICRTPLNYEMPGPICQVFSPAFTTIMNGPRPTNA